MTQRRVRLLLALLLTAFCRLPAPAQRVGLVLSGGGAKGLAYVGVLKELEKNHIPVDYVVGTSMGAVVGAMYAAGYSPAEIEAITLTPDFQSWASGKALEDHVLDRLFSVPSPAALHLGMAVDSGFHVHPSPDFVNDLNLNFALARLLTPASTLAHGDFDHLLVPFRCLAAEVFTRQQVVQKAGSLPDAVRNSMAFPLAFRPIRNLDGRYLFDGGVFNNFPVDVMRQEFAPDLIIGVNVGGVSRANYPFKTDDRLLPGALVFLGANEADTLHLGPNTLLVAPNVADYGIGDFAHVRPLIAAGETATRHQMARLKQRIGRRADSLALQQQRQQLRAGAPPLRFTEVRVTGLRDDQNHYVTQFFRRRGDAYTLAEIEAGYSRLTDDQYFRNVYPRTRYDEKQGGYVFTVDNQRTDNVTLDAGLVLASRPIDNLYLGLQYQYLRRWLYSAGANAHVGPFYNAAQGSVRIHLPGRVAFYVEPEITYSQWHYQRTGGFFGRDVLSTQVRQADRKLGFQVGSSIFGRSRVLLDVGAFSNTDGYLNSPESTDGAAMDRLTLAGGTAALRFVRYTLNRKQYATAGQYLVATLRGVSGTATYTPGFGSEVAAGSAPKQWLQFRATAQRYFPLRGEHQAWGYFLELMASSQGTFPTYYASLTTAPAFAPLPDSHTLFLPAYRSARYVAAGLCYTRPVLGPVEWRTEVYAHVNARPLRQNELRQAERLSGLERPRLTASTGFVYQTPVGPLALHARFYDDPAARFGVYAHLGYLLFHNEALK